MQARLGLWVACALVVGACTGEGRVPPTTTVGTTGPVVTTTTTTAATSQAPTTTASTTAPAISTTTSSTTVLPATTTAPGWSREVDPGEPLLVWVVGDSLAGPLRDALRAHAADQGWLVITGEHYGGTGLVRTDVFDWFDYAGPRLEEVNPEAVVCLIGANDGQAVRSPGGWLQFGTPEWDTEYAARVGAFMDLLAGQARRVYWVEVPIMADGEYDARVQRINAVQRREAIQRRQVSYVEAYSLFQDEAGEFARELPDESGNLVVVRQADGIHFTRDGADRLARHVLTIIEADWGLEGAVAD